MPDDRDALQRAVAQLFPTVASDVRYLVVQASFAAGTADWRIRSHRDISADWEVETRISIWSGDVGEPVTLAWGEFARFFELREYNGCIVQLRNDVADRIAPLMRKIQSDLEEFEEYQRLRSKYED